MPATDDQLQQSADDEITIRRAPHGTDELRERWFRRFGLAIVFLAIPVSLVFDSADFRHGGWLGGDHLYHGGVALNLQAGGLVGRDYYAHYLSYYSGLYHLVAGRSAQLFGTSYDEFVSVASWFYGPAWIGALVLLGRRLWGVDWLRIGLLVLIGTFAAPFTTDSRVLWVNSLVPSGNVEWPVYPRDCALLGAVLVAWAITSQRPLVRTVVGGLFLGATITLHPQLGGLTAAFVVVTFVVRDRTRKTQALRELAALAGIALVVSAWWWWPHLAALVHDRPLQYGYFPGRSALRIGLTDLIVRLGIIGPLAVGGVFILGRARVWRDERCVVLAWLAVLAGALVIIPFTNQNFLEWERAWLFAGPALAAAAAESSGRLTRALPTLLAPIVALAIVATSVPALSALSDSVDDAWRGPIVEHGIAFPQREFGPVWGELNHRVRSHGGWDVLTYESYGAMTWARSGATVFDLWLPATFKTGFSVARSTGSSIARRSALQREAFLRGLPGVCALALRVDSKDLVLDRENGLVATHDVWPAARYRPYGTHITSADLRRVVAPGVHYENRSVLDELVLGPGVSYDPGFGLSNVTAIEVRVNSGSKRRRARFVVQSGNRREAIRVKHAAAAHTYIVQVTPHTPISILAGDRIHLLEVRGLERVPRLPGPRGPFVVSVAKACAP